ncbi:restriction endonuclease subunit S [Planococcus shixiaomingii]|uniref:restriction endonuclease subunit S n=1 Tax=Planococcus shixiaomingii TaxID=3058393 RepID=UPI002610F824|nr:restriction endonuclease subunit S [Planococcus sp. N022]WKA55357.1 restriction endonuclease subunit S [Planococcus sp. N022]
MEYKLKDCIQEIIDNRGRNPAQYYEGEKFPVIDNYLIQNDLYPDLKNVKRYIDLKTHDNFIRKYLKRNDVLMTLVGNGIGNVSLSPSDEVVIIQNTIGFRANNEILLNEYLYYYFKYSKQELLNFDRGSSQPSIKKTDILNMVIDIPTIKVQNSIISLLISLDRKIEVNNNIKSLLEELSDVLFQRWFIDFEFPNENRVPYKSNGGEMKNYVQKEIPFDWEYIELKDIIFQSKKTFNPIKSEVEEVAHFSLPAYDKQEYPSIELSDTIKSNKYIINSDSIIFSKMNPNTPRVWLPNINKNLKNVCSSEFVVLDTSKKSNQSFIYTLVKSKDFINFLINNTTGSTGSRQRVSPTTALSFKFPYNEKVVLNFEKTIKPLLNMILVLKEESQQLKLLRDTLIPKFMSGDFEMLNETEVFENVSIS